MANKRKPLGEAKLKKPLKLRLQLSNEILPIAGPKGKIISIDQSTSSTGVAFYDSGEIIFHGHTRPAGKTFYQRINSLEEQINGLIDRFEPALLIHETGGAHGTAKRWESLRGMVLAEYIVDRICHERNLPVGTIHNTVLKDVLADKQRILELKKTFQRSNMKPIKEDVRHAVCTHFKKPFDYFLSNDHCDAVALIMAYIFRPDLLVMV